MTLEQFKVKWTGKPCDFDKGGTFECVDLMRQYLVDVLGLPGYTLHALGAKGKAKDLYNNFTPQDAAKFWKIPNTPTGVPRPGDIVIFKTSLLPPWFYGISGHVGIVHSATVMKMVVFNQNYPTGTLPQLRTFTYKDCLGWLRKK